MLVSLSWKTCFLWEAILLCLGAVRSYSAILKEPYSCGCPDENKKNYYDLEPLGTKGINNPSFTVNSTNYTGYSYSYNPCYPFKIGPKGTGCKRDVAICWWVPNLKESPKTYKIIGNQRNARCDLDDETKTPIVVYEVHPPNEFQNRNSTVKLKCDDKRKDKAAFEVLDEDNWVFQLSYLWDGCPKVELPTKEPSAVDPMSIIVPAGAVMGILIFVVVPLVVWYIKRNNNNNVERQPILDIIHNQFEEGNQANGRRPRPIGSSYTRGDINVIRGAHALGAHA